MFIVRKGSVPEKSGVRDRVALLPGALLTGSTVVRTEWIQFCKVYDSGALTNISRIIKILYVVIIV